MREHGWVLSQSQQGNRAVKLQTSKLVYFHYQTSLDDEQTAKRKK